MHICLCFDNKLNVITDVMIVVYHILLNCVFNGFDS